MNKQQNNNIQILVEGFGHVQQFFPQGEVKPLGIVLFLKGLH